MRIKLTSTDLLKALAISGRAAGKGGVMPILEHAHLSVSGDTLTVRCTDLAVEIAASTNILAGDGGRACLPAAKLQNICKSLPAGAEVDIQAGEKAVVTSGRSRFSLATLPTEDFPAAPVIGGNSYTMPQSLLLAAVSHVEHAMGINDVRYYLNGMLLEMSAGVLRTVATDGHRLATFEGAVESQETIGVIVPRKGAQAVKSLLSNTDGVVALSLSGQYMTVETDDCTVMVKLIDGKFPDWRRVVPVAAAGLLVGKAGLSAALQRMRIVADEARRVRISVSGGMMQLESGAADTGGSDIVQVDHEGDAMSVSSNIDYLDDAISAMTGEIVTMAITGANTPIVMSAGSRMCLVMPMRD